MSLAQDLETLPDRNAPLPFLPCETITAGIRSATSKLPSAGPLFISMSPSLHNAKDALVGGTLQITADGSNVALSASP